MNFLIFFSIVLLIYASVNFYIWLRASQAMAFTPGLKPWFTGIFFFLACSYIVARVLEKLCFSYLSDILTWIGTFWLAAMLYFFLAAVLFDLLRLLLLPLPGFRLKDLVFFPQLKGILLLSTFLITSVILFAGYRRAVNTRLSRLEIRIPARQAERDSLSIAMASDIHLGTLINTRRLQHLVQLLNGMQPDIILLAGDIVDEDLVPVIRNNLGAALLELKAPLGVWGITGNHEYIGGADDAIRYLETHGIRMLRDTAVKLPGTAWLIGREDRDKPRFTGRERKSLEELLAGTDDSLPRILLDHQPFGLDKAARAGIDLQLSGHTHHGQLWPLSALTKAIYEVSRGYHRIQNTHFYVSTGFGSWGPPVRTGSRSEVVLVKVVFVKE
ncbi:MAG TPA: metallophosphoesterase [Bacteroidales bacterium]|nr:metallophosphoesterase [Bacteroidales bacterium]HSA44602.1 metallophosphoesterase [Bacteroidales bacterium]